MNMNTNPPQQPQSADDIFLYLRRQTSLFYGEKISPQRIAHSLSAVESGNILEMADIMSIMCHDGDLLAPFIKRIVGINSLPWSIQPASDKPSKKEQRNAANIQEIFESLIDVPALLLDLTSGILTGISMIEIADRDNDDGTSGWQQVAIGHHKRPISYYPKFVWRPLSWFQLNPDNRHDIRLRDMTLTGVSLEKASWIVHRHPLTSGYVGETGILRQLIFTYARKNYAEDDWSELLEILGIPPRIGKFPAGANARDKAVLRKAVTDLGHSAAGIMPENMKLELLESASLSGGNPFQDRIELAIRTFERLVLGASTEDVAKLSSVEGQRFINHATFQRNKWDCHFLQETIRHQIIYYLNGYNNNEWNPLKTPRFVFDPRPVGEFAGNADALLKLIHAGIQIPKKWAHDFFNIPEPGEGEEVLKVKNVETITPPAQSKDDEIEEDDESENDDMESKINEDKATALKRNIDDEDDIEMLAGKKAKNKELWQTVTGPFVKEIKKAESYDDLDGMFSNVLETENLSTLTQDLAFYNFVKTMEGRLIGRE